MCDKLNISENYSTYRRVRFTYRNSSIAGYQTICFRIRSSMQKEDFDNKILMEYKRQIEESLKENKVTLGEIKLMNFQIEVCVEAHGNLKVADANNGLSIPVHIDQAIHEFEKINIT